MNREVVSNAKEACAQFIGFTNDQLISDFPDIINGEIVVVGISDNTFQSEVQGKMVSFIPVLLAQSRDGLRAAGGAGNAFFRNWGGGPRILRCFENAIPSVVENLEVGQTLPGFSLSLHRDTEPFYDGQNPMEDGEGNVLMHAGQPVYENVVFTEGEPEDSGLDMVFDTEDSEATTFVEAASKQ